MTTRITRASAARAAAKTTSFDQVKEIKPPQQLSSPPATPSPTKKTRFGSLKSASRTPTASEAKGKAVEPRTPVSNRKRKRALATPAEEDVNELPHNLGKVYSVVEEKRENVLPVRTRRAGRQQTMPAQMKEELEESSGKESDAVNDNSTRLHADELLNEPAAVEAANDLITETETSTAKEPRKPSAKKRKANPYGLTPGETPYPDWPHPTPEECQEVNDLLSKVHGEVKAPATVPAPSTIVSGCGEVPSILDALIRTLLSAATTGTNSSRAFKGLVDKFGILGEGIGKGSVDWDRVRHANVKEVFQAIKSGGLAATKSKRIKEILDMVYQENQARREALIKAKEDSEASEPPGGENESMSEKKKEVARAEQHVLSLDHLHALSSDDALNALIKYPGIGPKTAACVLLFCMQRPSFAVDTHVFRLCKWLNWVPEKASRNTTYSHCEVRVPDHLKYSLHQLMICHGKTCPRCRAATGERSENWDKGCPIDHLVKRSGKRKGKPGGQARKNGTKNQKKKTDETDEDEVDHDAEEADDVSESDHEEASGMEEDQSGDEKVEEEG